MMRIVNRTIIDDNNDEIVRGSRYIRFAVRLQIKNGYRYIGTDISNEILARE